MRIVSGVFTSHILRTHTRHGYGCCVRVGCASAVLELLRCGSALTTSMHVCAPEQCGGTAHFGGGLSAAAYG